MGRDSDNVGRVLADFVKRLGHAITLDKVILFGSRARGDALKSSDYDLIIVSSSFEGMAFIKRPATASRYWTEPQGLEAICYTPQEFATKSKQIGIVQVAIEEGTEITAA